MPETQYAWHVLALWQGPISSFRLRESCRRLAETYLARKPEDCRTATGSDVLLVSTCGKTVDLLTTCARRKGLFVLLAASVKALAGNHAASQDNSQLHVKDRMNFIQLATNLLVSFENPVCKVFS